MHPVGRFRRHLEALLVSFMAFGCASANHLEAGFGKGWHYDHGTEAQEVLRRIEARPQQTRPPIAVGLSGREVVGRSLAQGETWHFAVEVNVLPSISGGWVAFSSGPKVVVLDATNGTPLFEMPSSNRRLEAFASDGAHALMVLVDEHDARPDLILSVDKAGKVLSEVTTLERVGGPWVGGGIGLIPWANQYVSAIDLETGQYLGRFLSRTAPNRVFEASAGLFLSGGGGLVQLGPELAREPNLPAAHLSVRGFPGEPEWPVDASKPRIARATPIAIAADPESSAGRAKIRGDRFIATYFQIAAAFSAASGAPLWVTTFPKSIAGITANQDGALVCLDDGSLHTLDWTSGTKSSVSTLGGRVSGCVVDAGDLSIARHEAEPVEGRIMSAIRDTGPSMAAFQKFLIEKLATLESADATKALIALSLDPLSSSVLLDTAKRGLEGRSVGYDLMIQALSPREAAALGAEAERPPPYASLARALARGNKTEAAGPLARALVMGNLSGEDALTVTNAILILGGDPEVADVREFFVRHKNIATDEEQRDALVQAARFLWRRGGAARKDVEDLSVEAMTQPELRTALGAAFQEEANPKHLAPQPSR